MLIRALSCIQSRGPSLADYRSVGLKSSGHLPVLHKERFFSAEGKRRKCKRVIENGRDWPAVCSGPGTWTVFFCFSWHNSTFGDLSGKGQSLGEWHSVSLFTFFLLIFFSWEIACK